jgi:hypothetical protein
VLRIRISDFGHKDSGVQYVISPVCSFSHLRVYCRPGVRVYYQICLPVCHTACWTTLVWQSASIFCSRILRFIRPQAKLFIQDTVQYNRAVLLSVLLLSTKVRPEKFRTIGVQGFYISSAPKPNSSFEIQYNRTVLISVLFGYPYRTTSTQYVGPARKMLN